MQFRPIHPFPARMAPDVALDTLAGLSRNSVILDPMAGSGTVLRQAVDLGHKAIGFDVDPLAVLMSRVWTTPIDPKDLIREQNLLVDEALGTDLRCDRLTWMDSETTAFIRFWFGVDQCRDLKRIAYVLQQRRKSNLGPRRRAAVNALMVALSRIIITKDQGASLARDTSHSRPHKVCESSDYDVFAGLERSVKALERRLNSSLSGNAAIDFGDARCVNLKDCTVDAVLTSPPYLNAIDYMRGHRLALVWLGYRLKELRAIRSDSIGAERSCISSDEERKSVCASMLGDCEAPNRLRLISQRYAGDLISMMSEVARVLKVGGTATIVVGNSCLKDIFIQSAEGVRVAGEMAKLNLINMTERALPADSRYLPITSTGALSKRMRTEVVLSFQKP